MNPPLAPPVRVLHVLPWVTSGGVERRRLTMARQLGPRFHQRIVCMEARRPLVDLIRSSGVEVDVLGGRWSMGDLSSMRRLRTVIDEFRPDIVHGAVFEGVAMSALATLLAGRFPRVSPSPRLILEETAFPNLRSWRGDALFRALAATADVCVAVSPVVYRYLTETLRLPKTRVRQILNGVEPPSKFSEANLPQLRDRFGIPHDAFVLGSVGRVHDHNKRFSDLIKVASRVGRIAPELRLLIVGDGPDLPRLRQLAAELAVADRVIFAGYQAKVEEIYPLMNAFALVSNTESFGLVLVEAMFASLPVIATRVGGMRDIVVQDQTGLFVDVGDEDGIAEGLLRLMRNPALSARLGETGRQRAVRYFSAARYVSEIEHLYTSLVPQTDLLAPEPSA